MFPPRLALVLSMARPRRTFSSLPCCFKPPPLSPAPLDPHLCLLSSSASPSASHAGLFPLTPFRGWLLNVNFPAHLQPLGCAQRPGTLFCGGTGPRADPGRGTEEGGTSGRPPGEKSARQPVTSRHLAPSDWLPSLRGRGRSQFVDRSACSALSRSAPQAVTPSLLRRCYASSVNLASPLPL